MKTTRLVSFWDIDQVITIIDMLDELRFAILDTYQQEIDEYRQQQAQQQMDLFDQDDEPDWFDNPPF